MLVIFGLSRKEHVLAALPRPCGRCGHGGPQALVRRSTRFSLFFVPVLPLRSRHEVTCRWCGASDTVSRDEASRLQARVQSPVAQWADAEARLSSRAAVPVIDAGAPR